MKRHIVILGAGFGGLACAKRLSTLLERHQKFLEEYEIILVDQHEYQLYSPTLYEIATTPEEVANAIELKTIVTFPLHDALHTSEVVFIQSKVKEIDQETKCILLEDGEEIGFEYLVIALGGETNFFGIPGLEAYSYPLKTFYDALRIRDAILSLFQAPSPRLSFLIAGAGPTGVELAGELARWIRYLERKSLQRCACKITLLEATPDILPGFKPHIVARARKRLAKLGIQIKTNATIKEVRAREAFFASGEKMTFDLLVWAGGVKTPATLTVAPYKAEKRGRVEVNSEMLCISTDPHLDLGGKVFAIGDISCFYDPKTQKPIAGVARAAIEQGKVVAYNILADFKRLPRKVYSPLNYPYIIPIGGKWAIAHFSPFTVYGFFGWIIKGLVELYYIVSVLPFKMAFKIWLKGLQIFIQND